MDWLTVYGPKFLHWLGEPGPKCLLRKVSRASDVALVSFWQGIQSCIITDGVQYGCYRELSKYQIYEQRLESN